MKVLALCDSFSQALRCEKGLSDMQSVELDLLVCNNSGRSGVWFFLAQLRNLLRAGASGLGLAASRRFRLDLRPVHHPAVIARIRREQYAVGLHGMGVIYREPLIQSFARGILNAHIGKLPDYRGRSVMEWSLLEGAETGVSTFFIDTGIDTGSPIVRWQPISPVGAASIGAAKQRLFSQDVKQYRLALEALVEDPHCSVDNPQAAGRRYYVMSTLLSQVVTEKLRRADLAASNRGRD